MRRRRIKACHTSRAGATCLCGDAAFGHATRTGSSVGNLPSCDQGWLGCLSCLVFSSFQFPIDLRPFPSLSFRDFLYRLFCKVRRLGPHENDSTWQ
jgi:hypothetical protein